MSNGKIMIVDLIAGLIKMTQCNSIDCIKMRQYFPKPYEPIVGYINVKVDQYNYATKRDIKDILHVNTSSFALKSNLPSFKTEVDKLDINKLKHLSTNLINLKSKLDKLNTAKLAPVPVDLNKLSNVVMRSLKRLNIMLR